LRNNCHNWKTLLLSVFKPFILRRHSLIKLVTTDIDPEDEPFLSKHEKDDESSADSPPVLNGTGHYLDVGYLLSHCPESIVELIIHRPSKLRKLHDSLNEPKYAGKRIDHELGTHAWEDEPQEYSTASQDDSDSASISENTEEGSEDGTDTEMQEPQVEAVDDLSNALKKAKESDRLKGKAVSRQMVCHYSSIDCTNQT
jgi:hypothetical protein